MATKNELKIDDKVKHRFRKNKYQNCTILEIEDGCNGLIKVHCEDGFYGEPDEAWFCPQDLAKIE